MKTKKRKKTPLKVKVAKAMRAYLEDQGWETGSRYLQKCTNSECESTTSSYEEKVMYCVDCGTKMKCTVVEDGLDQLWGAFEEGLKYYGPANYEERLEAVSRRKK
jgi:peptide subunit release factor 1 (eRF1)